jgi:diguanylate cyclase (GGDEF)-like protein
MEESTIQIDDASRAADGVDEARRRAQPAHKQHALTTSEHTTGPARQRRDRPHDADPGAGRDLAFRRGMTARRERRHGVAGLAVAAIVLVVLVALARPLDFVHRPPGTVAAAIAVLGLAVAVALVLVEFQRGAGPNVLLAGTLALTGLSAWLVARSGGVESGYASLLVAPALLAAAFLDRWRFAVALLAALGAGLAPALYDADPGGFLRLAAVLAPAAAVAAIVVHLAAAAQRAERDALLERAAEATRQAEIDPLTGLGNYRAFWNRLEGEIARARRHQEVFSLILLDLDEFKAVNDEVGHQAGDDALRRVAAALRGAIRDEDVCCRQGGDEFAVIAVAAGELEVRELAGRLGAAVGALPLPEADGRRVQVTAGWSTYGRPAASADDLILRADDALRAAKRRRRPGPRMTLPSAARIEGADRLSALTSLSAALAGARSERAVADALVVQAAGALAAAGAQCVRWDGGQETPLALAATGAASLHPEELELAHETFERGRARVLVGAGAGGRERSALAAPILVGDAPWGYLLVAAPRGGSFAAAERELAEAMAAEAARALALAPVFAALPASEPGELYRLAAEIEPERGESWRVADLAWQVGRRLEMDGDELQALYLAGLFHDVGASALPAETLAKTAPLEDAERALLRNLPVVGERLLAGAPALASAAPIVRHGRERFDGSGHPDGLVGEAIPLAARVLLACDAWVAMTSDRPWRSAFTEERARDELASAAGGMLDPTVVRALLAATQALGEAPAL